jgi:GT2 family glycosyltransferase
MDVSVIIVNYNTRELILQCLKSIFKHTRDIEFEVIVIDNNSIDGSQQMIKDCFPQVFLIENSENIGFGRANNIGAEIAKGKYLFLLNSDTILLNNSVKLFYDFIETHKELKIGVVGGILFDKNNKITHSSSSFPSKRAIIKSTLIGYLTKRYRYKLGQKELIQLSGMNALKDVDYVTGADIFIPSILFKYFGGFDSKFFIYFEETDLQLRMSLNGYKRIVIQGPQIIHLQGASDLNPAFSIEKRMIYIRSMFYYFKKNSSCITYWLFRVLYAIIRLPLLFDTRISITKRLQFIDFLFFGE